MNSSKIFKRKAADPDCKKASFTLAETLLTLAIIGIVAAMVMPALMTKCNSFIWSTGQDLFEKKLDVAMRMMNTNDTVEGYDTTESFANELKNNIKITEICTGDNITNCFPEKIIWTAGEDPIEVTSDIVHYVKDNNQDWAETVGVRFNNGVEALIAYDKNCTGDPLNNQFAASECLGIIYDVSGHKSPNTNGKDLLSNANVLALGGDAGCVYELSDGTCFTKILSPGTGYSALTYAECTAQKSELGLSYCCPTSVCPNNNDYYAGAAKACGGKSHLPSLAQLATLANDLYNTSGIGESTCKAFLTLDTDKASAFISVYGDKLFTIWANKEYNGGFAENRYFYSQDTGQDDLDRYRTYLAVCVEN